MVVVVGEGVHPEALRDKPASTMRLLPPNDEELQSHEQYDAAGRNWVRLLVQEVLGVDF